MQEKSLGAYSAESGWVSSLTAAQLKARQQKIVALEKRYIEEGKDGGAVHHGGSNVLTSAGTEGTIMVQANFDAVADAKALRVRARALASTLPALLMLLLGHAPTLVT